MNSLVRMKINVISGTTNKSNAVHVFGKEHIKCLSYSVYHESIINVSPAILFGFQSITYSSLQYK